ncbi:hypothetical protein Aab01nite_66680 [Paractinoplanes abujensis]|uniref:Uncharacterized protein n=1 Tax=Paractinoplanes abujensis TaxID=882441 RepID=A0A7W7CW23_9ACTN|nr:hypothetical protein [Actinoplanes abujensis]MBB4695494.1 hypothetical protein [Actinoplanes abujensis]GID23078.1 hypothetical protein Aab01nite_66680 [Actinoplanes abujensis]
MSNRIVRAALSAVLVAGSTALVLSVSGPAHAVDLTAPLPIASFGDIVVNPKSKLIFISDPAGGKLITTNYAGVVQKTVDKLPGIAGLALDEEDGDVLAALPDAKAIAVFNQSGTPTQTFTASGNVRPVSLARAGGRIWFGEADGGIGRLDRSGDEPDLVPDAVATSFTKTPVLTGEGDLLAATDPAAAGGAVSVVNVAADTPAVVTAQAGAGQAKALAFGAGRLLVAGNQNLARALRTADLSTLQSYTAAADNNAVAVAPTGNVAIGTSKAVSVFASGSATASKQFTVKTAGVLQPGALAWQPDGPRLFGVTGQAGQFDLQIFGDPAVLATKVELTVPAKVELGKTVTVTGAFTGSIPAGLPMVITRKDAAGSRKVGPATVPANGKFTISDKPARAGTVTYTVTFAGNGDHSAATVTKSFGVGTTKATTLTLTRGGSGVLAYGSTVTLTAKLGPAHSSRVVEIWADPFGADQANRLVRKATANSRGFVTATFKVTRNTTFSAVYRGDLFTAARTAKVTVSARTSVTTSIARAYKVAKIGGVSYHHLRKSVNPYITTKSPAVPGRRVYLQLEYFNGQQWRVWQAGYFEINEYGNLYNELSGTHTAGIKYRIRAIYLYAKSGDTLNATTYGNYQYFTFTN